MPSHSQSHTLTTTKRSIIPSGLALLLVIGFIFRVILYISLDTEWNNNERIIRGSLRKADTLEVFHERKPDKILFELDAKSEVQHFLNFLDFEPTARVSFWRHPMVPAGQSKPRKYIKDSMRIQVLHGEQLLGHFWIQPSSRELTFIPSQNSNISNRIPQSGTLTQASYNNIAYWFLTYGLPHYAKTIPLNETR